MPATIAAPQDDVVLGVVSNDGPGAVCAICLLPRSAQDFAAEARKSRFTYAEIASAMSEGLGRAVSQKSLWHHLHHKGVAS